MNRNVLIMVLTICLSSACLPTHSALTVITDVPVTHSLVSMVMGDTGSPTLLLEKGASPHDYAMRPSKVDALRQAHAIIWTGPDLTPWLPRAMASRAPDIRSIELLSSEGTETLPLRDSPNFAADAHGHNHGESGIDPHAWLDPRITQYWLQIIADALSEIDPGQRTVYQTNAKRAIDSIAKLDADIEKRVKKLRQKPYIVFHDSYQYFENRYQLPATASISLGDGTLPGIRQIKTLRTTIKEHPGTCVFAEPQFSDRLIDTITEKLIAKKGVLDPLGHTVDIGPMLYLSLMENLTTTLEECLNPSADALSTDAPSADAPSADTPSADAPSADAPSADAPSADAPSADAPSADAPSADAPSADAPSADAPSADAPSADAPSADAPSADAPSADAPSADAPSADAPSADAPSADAPSADAPSADAPSADAPSAEEPTSEVSPPTTRGAER